MFPRFGMLQQEKSGNPAADFFGGPKFGQYIFSGLILSEKVWARFLSAHKHHQCDRTAEKTCSILAKTKITHNYVRIEKFQIVFNF
jgi:hypothetical protein